MSEQNAFPTAGGFARVGDQVAGEPDQPGMTLRQWYAGLAMQGILANPHHSAKSAQAIRDFAFAHADTMMANKPQQPTFASIAVGGYFDYQGSRWRKHGSTVACLVDSPGVFEMQPDTPVIPARRGPQLTFADLMTNAWFPYAGERWKKLTPDKALNEKGESATFAADTPINGIDR